MKKKVPVIILIALAFLFSGCTQDQYAIEKQYYHALKQAEKIFRNPQASPPNQLDKVVKIFEGFSSKYPKSRLALDAEFKIVSLYMAKEEYPEARSQLKKIISDYSKVKDVCSEAVFFTGKAYEAENKWDQALAQYNKIMQEYPLTLKGLSTPLYLIAYYKSKFQPDKMREAANEGIGYYNGLAKKYPRSPFTLRCETLAADCYAALKDWQGVVDTFNKIIENYKDKVSMDGVLLNVAAIYKRELKDDLKAKAALERLIKDYPKSKLVKGAKELLKKING